MSLPNSLSVSLKRFQAGSRSIMKILPDRSNYPSASIIQFQLPRSGCLDLQSLSLLADLTVVDDAVVTLTTPKYNSQMFRRVTLNAGGQPISLSQLSDYAAAYLMARTYSNPKAYSDYKQVVGKEGGVTVSSINGTVSHPLVLASDFLGFLSGQNGVRYLPLEIMPPLSIEIQLHTRDFWTAEANTAVTSMELTNVRMLATILQYEDNMIARMWADRISKSPIVIPFDDWVYNEGQSSASSTNVQNAMVNSQSVNYIIATYRPADYATSAANRFKFYAGNSSDSVENQITFNGYPLTNFQANVLEALEITTLSLNGGGGNVLFTPDISTYAEFRDTSFALVHSMKSADEEVDPRGWVLGTSTLGQAIEVQLRGSGLDTTAKKPVIFFNTTGTLEIGAGKQLAVSL